MNFANYFTESWNTKFRTQVNCPLLDCLKADQFNSLSEQKEALEFEESRRCAIIEELKQQLNHEIFIAEFLQKCIQKLSAVSHVFNEMDQCDSKSSSSSGTTGQRRHSSGSPYQTMNGSLSHTNNILSHNSSSFSLFPQCIASSLMHSASPLLAAAAAGQNPPFLMPSTLPQFSTAEMIKSDPDSESNNGKSPFLLNELSYGALSRLSASSSFAHTTPTSNNPFSNASNFPLHSLNTQAPGSIDLRSRDERHLAFPTDYVGLTSSSEAHAQAAAAVVAAFGLGFPSVCSRGNLNGFSKPDSQRNDSVATSSSSLQSSPPVCANGKDPLIDSSVDRPYQCATCSRTFAVKAGLVQHMRTHTDERPYPCSHCGRAFKQKIQLTTHMRVHSGERPYGCRLCGKLFRQQSHVVQHLRTHTGEKPHKCYQCGKAFRQKYSLISHQRRMCRNRAASNPIAAGMTMWISPGAGGDTCNLVKEFSPARGTTTTFGPNPASSPTGSSSSFNLVVNSAKSPFSSCVSNSPPVSVCQSNGRVQELPHCTGTPQNVSTFHQHSNVKDSFVQKVEVDEASRNSSTGRKNLDSEICEEDEEGEYVDDSEEESVHQPVCGSRPTRLLSTQNTTALELS